MSEVKCQGEGGEGMGWKSTFAVCDIQCIEILYSMKFFIKAVVKELIYQREPWVSVN